MKDVLLSFCVDQDGPGVGLACLDQCKTGGNNREDEVEKSKIKTNPLPRHAKMEEMRPRPGLATLFDMGCGFTEFLSNVFHNLPLPQVFTRVFVSSDLPKIPDFVVRCCSAG